MVVEVRRAGLRGDRLVPRPSAHRMGRVLGIAAVITFAQCPALHAEPRWQLEARVGSAWNAPLPIVLRQEGHEDLRLTARWKTEALELPLYYGWRIARWRENFGWAVDLTHHKLYLQNPPPEVRNFAISHGYNLVTLQRLAERGEWLYGGGVGAVVSHPESEVRGRRFEERGGLFPGGYYVSGPTASALFGHSRTVRGRLHAAAEVRITLSNASVPIAGGTARVPNLAVHGTVGLGWCVPP